MLSFVRSIVAFVSQFFGMLFLFHRVALLNLHSQYTILAQGCQTESILYPSYFSAEKIKDTDQNVQMKNREIKNLLEKLTIKTNYCINV